MAPRNFNGTGRRPEAYWAIMSLSCLGNTSVSIPPEEELEEGSEEREV